MRQGPSLVSGTPEDFYVVVNRYGKHGIAFAETGLDRANYETTIAGLISGQHSDPLRVIMFNPETNRSEDVSRAIAQEILRRLGLEGPEIPRELEDFIDRHAGRDLSSICGWPVWNGDTRLKGPSHADCPRWPMGLRECIEARQTLGSAVPPAIGNDLAL